MRHTSRHDRETWTPTHKKLFVAAIAVSIAWSAVLVWGAWAAVSAALGE